MRICAVSLPPAVKRRLSEVETAWSWLVVERLWSVAERFGSARLRPSRKHVGCRLSVVGGKAAWKREAQSELFRATDVASPRQCSLAKNGRATRVHEPEFFLRPLSGVGIFFEGRSPGVK